MQYVCRSEGMCHQQQHHPQPQQYLQSSQQYLQSSQQYQQYPVSQSYASLQQQQVQQPSLLTPQQQQQFLQQLVMLTFPADVCPMSVAVACGSGRTVHLKVTPSGLAPLPSTSTRDLTISANLLDPNVTLASLLDLQPTKPATPSMSLISEDTTGVLNTPDHVSRHKDGPSHLISPHYGPF